jgi:photosystem II stability/assembly factor-like uncharacterized protein
VRARAFEQYREILRRGPGFLLSAPRAAALASESFATAVPGLWIPIGPQPSASSDFPPFTSGRIGGLAVDPRNQNVIYVGGAQGGVWKSTDGGLTWTALTDDQPSLAIGSIVLAPSNPDIIYVGTGEQTFSVSSYYGAGILKSTDGGQTWQHLPGPFVGPFTQGRLSGGAFIGSLAVHPTDPNIVLAGVFQPGSSANSGILRSTDGGQSWSVRLSGAPGNEVVFASPDGQLAFAALGATSSNPANGVYRSTDGGQTWTRISITGFPTTDVGRIEIGVARSNPDILYAGIQNSSSSNFGALLGFFKTTNARNPDPAGVTWTRLTTTPDYCRPQCWYDHVVRVHPSNPNIVFAGGAAQFDSAGRPTFPVRTLDGGNTWEGVGRSGSSGPFIHVDTHAIEFANPPTKLYVGNDGGVWSTTNIESPASSLNWTNLNGQAGNPAVSLGLVQFYPGGSIHPSTPDIAFGGSQDNSTQRYTGGAVWDVVTCGDGAWTAFDPQVPSTVYSNCQQIDVRRSFRNGLRGTFSSADDGINPADRVAFIPPFIQDPNISGRLYFGTFRVWRSNSHGDFWQAISPDLAGGTGTLSTIAVAPSDSNIILTGSSTGRVFRSTDGGTSWTECTTSALPPRFVTQVAAHPTNANVIFVTYSGFSGFVDNVGHVFRATGCGTLWTDISGNLPNIPVNDIVIDTDADPTGNTLYIATDLGVLGTTNGGISWAPLAPGLPNVAVLALKLHRNSRILRAWTHGRSAWDLQLDNFTPSFNIHTLDPPTANAGSGPLPLRVRGNGLAPDARVVFDGTELPPPTTATSNELETSIPSSLLSTPRAASVTVRQNAGTAVSNALVFTVMASAPPTLSSISPTTAPLNGSGFTLTANGSGFTSNSQVRWNGQDRPTTFVSANQLTAQIPASDLTVAGAVSIRVFEPTPGAGSSNSQSLLVQATAPPNDDFSNARIINATPFTHSVATTGATSATDDPAPSCVAGLGGLAENGRARSVWFRFTAAANGTVNVDTQGSNYDTILAVFTGSPGNFSEVACNDDVDPGVIRHSQLSFNAVANTAYSVMVSAFVGDGGSLTLNTGFSFPAPPFQLVPNPVRNTVTAGSAATYTIVVAPSSTGFSNPISLACTNLPVGSACSFSPVSVTPGSNNVNVSLTISTTRRSSAELGGGLPPSGIAGWPGAFVGVLVAVLVLVSLLPLRRMPMRRTWALPLLVLALLASSQLACGGGGGGGGGGGSSGTPAGLHTISVNGTSGATQQSVNISLQVQ